MKLNTLMIVFAIVATVFGLGFVLVPSQVFSLYGAPADAPIEFTGQLLGAALLAFAVLTWTARNAPDSGARRAILLALFIGESIGFIVALIAQLGGAMNAVGWSTVVIYFLFAVGFGYFRFAKPETPDLQGQST
jgi:hypothetical protein